MSSKASRPVIKISIDPGFSSLKVICEGIMFSFPGDVIDNTGNEDKFISGKKSDYVAVNIFGKNYLVGTYARKLLLETNRQLQQELKQDVLTDFERFGTDYFEISMKAALGIALVRYCELTQKKHLTPEVHIEDLPNCDIYVSVAVPHKVYELGKQGPGGLICQRLYGQHSFILDYGENHYDLNFNVVSTCAYKLQSQVIAALLGAIDDEYNEPLEIIDTRDKMKPIVVIDGGYKTVGIFKLSQIDTVEEAESNPDFGMMKVDEAVAAQLKERGRNDFKSYNIQELYDSDEEIAVKDDEETHYITVRQMRDKSTEEFCSLMIDYLREKYDNLLPIKQILFTGGTGAAYYETFVKYINSQPDTQHLKGRVKLAHYKFMGQEVEPMYAIVTGLYKQFKRYLDRTIYVDEE